jgi:glycosyltransferase involved in cell wall biosynthesis
MTNRLVSVIVPVFNRRAIVLDTLESIFGQTYRPLEVLFVDDGSTDGTVQILDDWAAEKRKEGEFDVAIYRQVRAGASAARNHGFSRSRGEFVQFLDSDDLLAPSKIRRQVGPLSAAPAKTAVFGGWRRFAAKRGRILTYPPPLLPHPASILYDWLSGKFLCVHCFLWRRSDLMSLGPWDETLHRNGDGDFAMRFFLEGGRTAFVEGGLSYYRTYLDSSPRIVSDLGRKALESDLRVHMQVEAALRARGALKSYRGVLARAYYELAEDAAATSEDIKALALARFRALSRRGRIPGGAGTRLLRRILGPSLKKRIGLFLREKAGIQPFRPSGSVDSVEALYALDPDP